MIQKNDSISLSDVYKHVEARTVPAFLVDRFDRIDVSIIEQSDWRILGEEWANYHNAIDADRKFGVINRGICLLLAYAMQSLEDRRRAVKKN